MRHLVPSVVHDEQLSRLLLKSDRLHQSADSKALAYNDGWHLVVALGICHPLSQRGVALLSVDDGLAVVQMEHARLATVLDKPTYDTFLCAT